MKAYHGHRAEPYFTFLKTGQKTIEGRIKKGKYSRITAGDKITVHNVDETEMVKVNVVRVTSYVSIKQMLEAEDYKQILPDADSIGHGLAIYERFYTAEQATEFGVVAIEVELVD